MIVEAAVAGGIGFAGLRRVPEEAKRGERPFERRARVMKAALDTDQIGRQRKSDTRDACRIAGLQRVVGQEAVSGLLSFQK